jgi:hypothetical protein
LSLQACTTPAITAKADDATTQSASNFSVQKDRAKVYFVNGKIAGNMFDMKHQYPSDFMIDGKVIASKNKEDVLVFELRPGKYDFSWNVRSTDPIDKNTAPQSLQTILTAGDILILRGDYNMGGAAGFGLIGAMISTPKTYLFKAERSDVQGKNVVVPQSCVETICLK